MKATGCDKWVTEKTHDKDGDQLPGDGLSGSGEHLLCLLCPGAVVRLETATEVVSVFGSQIELQFSMKKHESSSLGQLASA